MSELSPCPQCHGERVWARAALGAYGVTHVAFCPGCGRAATICTHCGTELVLMRRAGWEAPNTEASLQCPACRQNPAQVDTALGRGAGMSAALAAAQAQTPVRRGWVSRFVSNAPTPGMMQRVADDCEQVAAERYVRRHQLLGMVEEAARRADAMARLDDELRRLGH